MVLPACVDNNCPDCFAIIISRTLLLVHFNETFTCKFECFNKPLNVGFRHSIQYKTKPHDMTGQLQKHFESNVNSRNYSCHYFIFPIRCDGVIGLFLDKVLYTKPSVIFLAKISASVAMTTAVRIIQTII